MTNEEEEEEKSKRTFQEIKEQCEQLQQHLNRLVGVTIALKRGLRVRERWARLQHGFFVLKVGVCGWLGMEALQVEGNWHSIIHFVVECALAWATVHQLQKIEELVREQLREKVPVFTGKWHVLSREIKEKEGEEEYGE